MGVWGDLGKELGKAVLEGVAKSIQENQNRNTMQQRQNDAQYFAQNENDMMQAASNGDLGSIRELTSNYFLQGDYQNAIKYGRKGLSVNDDVCLFVLGEIALQKGNYEEAEQWFMRNINVNSDIDSACELGFIYIKTEDIERASQLFSFALNQNRSHPNASYGMASCMLQSESYDISAIKQLMQNALRSEQAFVRDDAQQTLQAIRESESNANYNNNNNNNNNGSGGCFITTAVCDSFGKVDDCYELTMFRNFRDNWLINQSDGKALIDEYYSTAPTIVDKINKLADSPQIYKTIWNEYLKPCLEFIEIGDNKKCKQLYIDMVATLKKRFVD